MLRSIGKQSGESVLKKKRKGTVVGFAEKEGFKRGIKEWGGEVGYVRVLSERQLLLALMNVAEFCLCLRRGQAGGCGHE